ncbi:hypothetical protein HDU77_010952, partial [Chytriomyces hyalinus]
MANDFDLYFSSMASDTMKVACWKYFCKRIENPAWEPICIALLSPNEEEVDCKLDVIATFLKTSESDSLHKFTTKEDIMWTALQTPNCLSLPLLRQKIECVDFASDDWLSSGNFCCCAFVSLITTMAWDPNSNVVILDTDQLPSAVYCCNKSAPTNGEYTHPLLARSCSLIHAIRDLSPATNFVLWDWTHHMYPRSYPENALWKLLTLTWHCIVLHLPSEPNVGDVTFNFLCKFAVTCMMGEGNLRLPDAQAAVAKAI